VAASQDTVNCGEVAMKESKVVLLVMSFVAAMFFCMASLEIVMRVSSDSAYYFHLTGVCIFIGILAGNIGFWMWRQGRRIEELERRYYGPQ
jgi:hypothetical protein